MQIPQAKLDSWVRSYGTNSNSYVLLEGPKSYFTSPAVDGFLAYQVSGGVALIAGDPVCAPEQAPRLISDFRRVMMRPVGAYQVSPAMLEAFRVEGFADVQIGKEAIFDLRRFTLAGGKMELVRAATNKARREGVVVSEHHPFAKDAEAINDELREISDAWLSVKGNHELGFVLGSLGLDQPSAKRYFIARSENGTGRIEGFVVCEPIYRRSGYYLDVTRRRFDAIRGTMELLSTEILRLVGDEGYEMASMGLAPLALLDLFHRWVLLGVALFVVVIRVAAQAQEPAPPDHYDPDDAKRWPDVVTEDRDVVVRGQQFTVHFYRPQGNKPATPAIYACGDGGWRGLAPRTAEQLAHIGFAVAGIDSKVYLREFSSVTAPLTIKQLARDYANVAGALRSYAKVDAAAPVYVYGWSLGAGFAIAVGSDEETRSNWAGIISIGLPKQNQLVSGVRGNHTNLNNETTALFGFRSEAVLPRIAPVPLVMIQSTSDTASPQKVGNALFASAGNPKKYVLIKASNHRFSGARDEFYAALADAVTWMQAQTTRKNAD